MTLGQSLAHFLRQVKGRSQAGQILVGSAAFLRILVIIRPSKIEIELAKIEIELGIGIALWPLATAAWGAAVNGFGWPRR